MWLRRALFGHFRWIRWREQWGWWNERKLSEHVSNPKPNNCGASLWPSSCLKWKKQWCDGFSSPKIWFVFIMIYQLAPKITANLNRQRKRPILCPHNFPYDMLVYAFRSFRPLRVLLQKKCCLCSEIASALICFGCVSVTVWWQSFTLKRVFEFLFRFNISCCESFTSTDPYGSHFTPNYN